MVLTGLYLFRIIFASCNQLVVDVWPPLSANSLCTAVPPFWTFVFQQFTSIMANETEQELLGLQEQLTMLQATNEWLTREQAVFNLNSASSLPRTSSRCSNVSFDRVVYIPREHKCPRFYGSGDSSNISVEEWGEEVCAWSEERHFSDKEKAQFLLDNLRREGRMEIKLHPQTDWENPENFLNPFRYVWWSQALCEVTAAIFLTGSKESGETQVSHALMSLMELILSNNPDCAPNSEKVLHDQFVEHVRKGVLCLELKMLVRQKPSASLCEVRKEAISGQRIALPAHPHHGAAMG